MHPGRNTPRDARVRAALLGVLIAGCGAGEGAPMALDGRVPDLGIDDGPDFRVDDPTQDLGVRTSPREEAIRASARRAAAYLLSFEGEIGADVVVALRVYGEVAEDEDVAFIAQQRRALLPADARRALAPALDGPLVVPSEAQAITPQESAGFPGDERDQTCPAAALGCDEPADCTSYLATPADGYGLTHQSLTLVFARWAGCANDDSRRHVLAHRLAAEQLRDPVASDLAGERIAMLGELGYAAQIDDAWIDAFIDAQVDDGESAGAFRWESGGTTAPHPTGMALWAYAQWFRARE
ncbi:MAG: hypothetical protein AAF411_04725 [Myxococcota bacterium]